MRVSSSQYHITVNASLQTANSQLEKLMGQMASGNRLTRPSDDPISHVRISRLQREEANNAQYLDNISALSSRMTQSESVLSNINNDFLEARDLLVWALDGTNTANDLAAMATNLSSLRDSLHASTLTRDQEGNYLFSGTNVKSPTVLLDGTKGVGQRYTMGGNADEQLVQVGNGLMQPANVVLTDGKTDKNMAHWLNTIDLAVEALGQGKTANDPGVRKALQDALNMVDVGMDEVSTRISRLGGNQNIIATIETNIRNLSTANQVSILDYAQLDYAEAAMQLNTLTAAIQATQGAYGKVSKLSLFDVL